MFLIPTYVSVSHINGVGLFTRNKVLAGTTVARWDPNFDMTFDQDMFEQFPEAAQQHIRKHGTKDIHGRWKLGADGDQYINHSDRPNLIRQDDKLIAERTILAREELTCDYRPFRNDIL